jgi:hypothetical protein
MTRRRCHIAAYICGLALVVALACGVAGPDAVAWAAGLLALAAVALGEAA